MKGKVIKKTIVIFTVLALVLVQMHFQAIEKKEFEESLIVRKNQMLMYDPAIDNEIRKAVNSTNWSEIIDNTVSNSKDDINSVVNVTNDLYAAIE